MEYSQKQWEAIQRFYEENNTPLTCKFCFKPRNEEHTSETLKVHDDLMSRGGHSFICTSPKGFADYVSRL